MNKKILIELMVYVVILAVGIILLFTYKPKEIEIHILGDYAVEVIGGDTDASLSI